MSSVHTFKWPKGPKEVILTGTFDHWSKSLYLVKQGDGSFELTVPLPAGDDRILYKYVVDGEWKLSSEDKVAKDDSGIDNNVLEKEDLVAALSKGVGIPEAGGLAVNTNAGKKSKTGGDFNTTVMPSSEGTHASVAGEPGIVIPQLKEALNAFKTFETPESAGTAGTAATEGTAATAGTVGTAATSVSADAKDLTPEEKKKQKKKVKRSQYKSKKKKKAAAGDEDEAAATPASKAEGAAAGAAAGAGAGTVAGTAAPVASSGVETTEGETEEVEPTPETEANATTNADDVKNSAVAPITDDKEAAEAEAPAADEDADREDADKEVTDKEDADKEDADKEDADKEDADKEDADKEDAHKEDADKEDAEEVQATKDGDKKGPLAAAALGAGGVAGATAAGVTAAGSSGASGSGAVPSSNSATANPAKPAAETSEAKPVAEKQAEAVDDSIPKTLDPKADGEDVQAPKAVSKENSDVSKPVEEASNDKANVAPTTDVSEPKETSEKEVDASPVTEAVANNDVDGEEEIVVFKGGADMKDVEEAIRSQEYGDVTVEEITPSEAEASKLVEAANESATGVPVANGATSKSEKPTSSSSAKPEVKEKAKRADTESEKDKKKKKGFLGKLKKMFK